MSGTSEGVIFAPPTLADINAGLLAAMTSGAILDPDQTFSVIAETFLARERESGHFLKVGDRIEYLSSSLGTTSIQVVTPD